MAKIIDLASLVQEPLILKFSEDNSFTIPPEPSVDFVMKIVDIEEKAMKAETNKEQFELLLEMVSMILSQDESKSNVQEVVKKLSTSQLKAIAQIYKESSGERRKPKLKLPVLPGGNKEGSVFSNVQTDTHELLEDFTYLARKMGFTHFEILQLPHSVFLAYLKHNRVLDLQETEEGRKYLEKARKFQNPRKHADLSAIRLLGGYTAEIEGGEK